MIIHWHKRAATQLQQVEDYVLQHFGERIRKEFMDEVEQVVTELADMPTMGKLDPLFAHRKQAYRSIIVVGLTSSSITSRITRFTSPPSGMSAESRKNRLNRQSRNL